MLVVYIITMLFYCYQIIINIVSGTLHILNLIERRSSSIWDSERNGSLETGHQSSVKTESTELFKLNSQSLKVVSRYRDPQLQVICAI